MQKSENKKPPTPFELFHVECGKGWDKLIKPLFDYIESYNQNKNDEDKIQVLQVKEKFGGLRFYVNIEPQELTEMIRLAENASFETCEFCGTTTNVGHTCSGWITTCCLQCIENQAKARNRTFMWTNKEGDKKYCVTPNGTSTLITN